MMRKWILAGWIVGFVFFSSSEARAEGIRLLEFRAGAVGTYHSGAGGNWFPQIAWTPAIDLQAIALRGELGFTALRDITGNRVGVSYFEVLAQYGFTDVITAELGGGFHTWGGGSGTNPAVSLGLSFTYLYLGYTHLFMDHTVNQYKIGVKFDLF